MRGTATFDEKKKPSSKKGKKKKKKKGGKRNTNEDSWDDGDDYEDPFDNTQAMNDRIRGGPVANQRRARDRYFIPNDMPQHSG